MTSLSAREKKKSGLILYRSLKEKLVVVVPRDHELAGRGSVDLKETLPLSPGIFHKNSGGSRPVIDQLFRTDRRDTEDSI